MRYRDTEDLRQSSMLPLSSKSMEIISFTLQIFFLDQRTVGTHWYETKRVSQIFTFDGTDIQSIHNVMCSQQAFLCMHLQTNTLRRYNINCFVLSQDDRTACLVSARLNSRCLRPSFSLHYSLVATKLYILHVISRIRVEFPSREVGFVQWSAVTDALLMQTTFCSGSSR